jgi:hypothetical protein
MEDSMSISAAQENSEPVDLYNETHDEADVFSFRFGGEEAFVIHDGALTLPLQPLFAQEATKQQVEIIRYLASALNADVSRSCGILNGNLHSEAALFRDEK